MINNPEMQKQFEAARQMAAQNGVSGALYLDFDPAKGFMKMRFKVTPPAEQANLVSSLAYVIVQMSQAFGLQVNTREGKSEEADNG